MLVLNDFQSRIQSILKSEMLDNEELSLLSATHGYVNACIQYRILLKLDDINSIEKEISSYENEFL